MDRLWHHGQRNSDGTITLKVSKRSDPITVRIPTKWEEITSLESALAFLLSGINLQRISGFKDSEGKSRKYSFSDCAGMIVGEYFFDTKMQVINWSRRIIMDRQFRDIVGFSPSYLKELSNYTLSQVLYAIANKGLIERGFAAELIRQREIKE